MDTDPFERRIELLNRSAAPRAEVDAAIRVYERLRTAKAVAATEFGEPPPLEAVLAVFTALCAEAQSGHGPIADE